MAVSLSISITQNSQSVANNTSNVTVKVTASWTYGSFNRTEKSGWLKIDGTQYNFTSPFNAGQSSTGSEVIFEKTVNVAHGSNGAKTLSCSASYVTGGNSGTVTATGSKTLTTIPRKSTLTVGNGTLGTEMTMTINEKDSSFKHKIYYTLNSTTTYIAGGSSSFSTSNSIKWTPPLSIASTVTNATSRSFSVCLATYTSGGTHIGDNWYSFTLTLPYTMKPVLTLSIVDETGLEGVYGAMVQGHSKMKITLKPTLSYGSPIVSYEATVNGEKHNTASFTTGFLKEANENGVSAKITDERGRVGLATASKGVLAYSPPIIEALAVHRCNADGTENQQGDHVKVSFSATATSLNQKNNPTYTLEWKKSNATSYDSSYVFNFSNPLAVSNASYIFEADTSFSYDVKLTAKDNLETVTKTTSASTGFALIHYASHGKGIGFGKICEMSEGFDFGRPVRHDAGLLPPVLEPDTDLNDVRTPNTYTGANVTDNRYLNCPVSSGTFTLIVESGGEAGQVKQTYMSCSKYKPERFSRFYYQGAWGDWFWSNTDEYVLYENDSGSNGTITLNAALSHYRYIEIYFTDNNGKSGGYTKVYKPDGKAICLNIVEPSSTIYFRQTMYNASGTSLTPDVANASYLRSTSAGVVSTSIGTNYIKIVRVIGRA